MKKRKIDKKLSLNKSTVTSLGTRELGNARGGDFVTGQICLTADGTACPAYCGPIQSQDCTTVFTVTLYVTCYNETVCF